MTRTELETYFANIQLPKELRINAWTYCHDVPKMVKYCISVLKSNPGNKRYLCYYEQLMELKQKLEE